jgi:hypothetical protein
MPYFHHAVCISPQQSFPDTDLSSIRISKKNLLEVVEPDYPGIPAGMKRRMGKSMRMAMGAALPLMEKCPQPDGIVIATANGGMEDCIKFLNQIVEYKEGLLTPASFVQSTSNAAAAQIALVTKNHNYNITHVHRGLAFENALLDVIMLLNENPAGGYLLGCTDEISAYNYNIDRLDGWYREAPVLNTELFLQSDKGTIAGEGAFMVWMNNEKEGAGGGFEGLKTLHTEDPDIVVDSLRIFLSKYLPAGVVPDLIMTGENGDVRMIPFIHAVESCFPGTIPVARFKHLCGEYCTASSFAVWLSMQILDSGKVPEMLIKQNPPAKPVRRILIYNNFRELQHSFMLISKI